MFVEHGFGGGLMWIIWLLIAVGVIGLTISLAKGDNSKQPSALDILKERYARGEIKEEEYRQMKNNLQR